MHLYQTRPHLARPHDRSRSLARQSGRAAGRLLIAAVIVIVSLVSYFTLSDENPITGEKQRVSLTEEQEIALGLQAAPQMMAQFGGEIANPQARRLVAAVGQKLLDGVRAEHGTNDTVYPFEFTVLADTQTVNAFALPGGQTFITAALLEKLKTEGQLAGVMAHEMGHVVHRHGAERLAKQRLTQGLASGAAVASGDAQSAQLAQAIGQLVNMKYGREDELESDRYGVRIMAEAGYDPRAMIEVMRVLAEASGAGRQPEFFSTHPNPDNRVDRIEQAIAEEFPNGVPPGLKD